MIFEYWHCYHGNDLSTVIQRHCYCLTFTTVLIFHGQMQEDSMQHLFFKSCSRCHHNDSSLDLATIYGIPSFRDISCEILLIFVNPNLMELLSCLLSSEFNQISLRFLKQYWPVGWPLPQAKLILTSSCRGNVLLLVL